jgi:MFS family permease
MVGLSSTTPSQVAAGAAVILGLLIFSFAEITAAPVAPALVNDLAPEHLRGSYNAAYGLTFSLAATLGPLVTAVTIGTGHPELWVVAVCLGCLTTGFLLALFGRTLTPEQQGVAN